MSQTFSLVCHETKKRIWVGQGCETMSSFYSAQTDVMVALGRFLREHEGKPLVLLCDDRHEEIAEYDDETRVDARAIMPTPSHEQIEAVFKALEKHIGYVIGSSRTVNVLKVQDMWQQFTKLEKLVREACTVSDVSAT